MKQISLFIILLILGTMLKAQAPEKINYQAVARDISGNPLINQTLNVTYQIRQSSPTGTSVYTETHTGISTNQFGLFTAEIGGGIPSVGTFAGINWGAGLYYLYVEVNGDPIGSSQLLSVPYALYAKQSANGPQGAPGKNSISIVTPEPTGANCQNGGNKIDVGTDDNGDNMLQPLEIDFTYYVCNGDSGATGLGINWIGNGTNFPPSPNNENDAFYHSIHNTSYIYNGTIWDTLVSGNVGSAGFWSQTGNTIYNNNNSNSGNVSIGTTLSLSKLTVGSIDSTVATFIGNNTNVAVITVANANASGTSGIAFVNGSNSNAFMAYSPSNKTLSILNGVTDGHLYINADSSIINQSLVIANQAQKIANQAQSAIYNNTDTIYNYSSTGLIIHSNSGSFLTDSLYVLGNNFLNINWILANDGTGQAKWTDPNTLGLGNDNWGTQVVISDATLNGNGTAANPLSVNGVLTDNQDLTLTGNILSLTNDPTPINLSPYIDNTDAQTLSINANTLSISNGNTVTLPTSPWTKIGTTLHPVIIGDNVGIGTSTPLAKLHVEENASAVMILKEITPTNGAAFVMESMNQYVLLSNETGMFRIENATNSLQPFNINPSGQVGINGSPFYSELDVHGKITMRNGATNGYIPVSDANGTMTWTDPNTVLTLPPTPWTLNGTNIHPTTLTNNVGIGTTNPSVLLDVQSQVNTTANLFQIRDNIAGIALQFSRSAITLLGATNGFRFNSPSNDIIFTTNNLSRMTIQMNGDIGMGTTTPAMNLHIGGTNGIMINAAGSTGNIGGLAFREGYTTLTRPFHLGIVTYDHSSGGAGFSDGLVVSGYDGIAFTTDNSATSTTTLSNVRMFINQTGNVGIGTTAPGLIPGATKYLSVVNNGPYNNASITSLELKGNTNGGNSLSSMIDFINGLTPTSIARVSSVTSGASTTQGQLLFSTNDGTLSEKMRITQTGNVGIGTTTPGSSLEINGAVTYTPATAAAGNSASYALTVGDRSYIRVTTTFGGATLGSISNGLKPGQLLIIENVGGYLFTINDGAANLNIAGNALLYSNDTITLIWTGNRWLEISRSDN